MSLCPNLVIYRLNGKHTCVHAFVVDVFRGSVFFQLLKKERRKKKERKDERNNGVREKSHRRNARKKGR